MSEHLDADRRVAAVIESSTVFGLIDRPLAHVWRAASSSAVGSTAVRTARDWARLDASLQRLAVGTMLLVAVATHVVFTLVTQTPPGWLWLVAPGIVSAIGLLLVVAPGVSGRTER